ncbi:hypothetical protein RHMOL_Rhmol09G0061200 [Rhododendron molle]|uniref:Uncharacterized protein n=1 Tax=Rhododendron molle TaxID=49168 RepID=A0ACC0MAP8_RHOML|nr:hypothetical protein RHMOL_Rhmol09G0061200 [Rhododendron molle]
MRHSEENDAVFKLQRRPLFWSEELGWASGYLGGTSFHSTILRLQFAAVVYDFQLESSARVFAGKVRYFSSVLNCVSGDMRNRICTWKKIGNCHRNLSLYLVGMSLLRF